MLYNPSMKKYIAIILTLFLFSSCVSYDKDAYENNQILSPSLCYIAFSFTQTRTITEVLNRPYHAVVKNLDTGEKFKIVAQKSVDTIMLNVPPGRYKFDNVTTHLFSPDYSSSSLKIFGVVDLPMELRKPFEIKPGQIMYIGEVHVGPNNMMLGKYASYTVDYYVDNNAFINFMNIFDNRMDFEYFGLN